MSRRAAGRHGKTGGGKGEVPKGQSGPGGESGGSEGGEQPEEKRDLTPDGEAKHDQRQAGREPPGKCEFPSFSDKKCKDFILSSVQCELSKDNQL